MNTVGTLLSQDPEVQPIVPMGLLAEELSCTITWKGKQCCVIHPDLGKLDVTVCRGCPEVSHDLCLSLILELEEQRSDNMLGKVRKAGIRHERSDTANAREFEQALETLRDSLEKWFPEVPVPLRERLLPKHAYSPPLSGLNRHCRRRLERGSAFVHLFAGGQKNQHPQGVPAVYLDLKAGHDLRDDGLYAYLLQLAFQGKISFLLAGPPCRTVSAMRQRGVADGGPGVVRKCSGTERFGIQGLEPELTQLVEGDSLLILRTIILAEASNAGLEAARDAKGSADSEAGVSSGWLLFFGMEHPEDPLEYLSAQKVEDKEEVPSIWVWPELRQFVERNGLYEASFHQGMLGHPAVKPTRVLTSSGYLWERLHLLKVPKGELWSPSKATTLQGRLEQSAAWAKWTPQLVSFFRDSMDDWLLGPAHCRLEDAKRQASLEHLKAVSCPACTSTGYCMRALSSKEQERFKRHCLNGHRPWRADCAACLDAMAFAKPHRRMSKSRACALSIDVSGPHKVTNAEDQDVAKPKYFMVGSYTYPLFGRDEEEGEAGEFPTEGDVELEEEPAAPEPPSDWEIPEHEPPKSKPISAEDRKALEADNKRWEDMIAACKEQNYRIIEIPFVEIMAAKSTQSIICGLNRFYARLRSWGLPIFRLHSDCAQEFTHPLVKQWAGHRGILTTTTIPEKPAMNGRAERLIGRVKQQVPPAC